MRRKQEVSQWKLTILKRMVQNQVSSVVYLRIPLPTPHYTIYKADLEHGMAWGTQEWTQKWSVDMALVSEAGEKGEARIMWHIQAGCDLLHCNRPSTDSLTSQTQDTWTQHSLPSQTCYGFPASPYVWCTFLKPSPLHLHLKQNFFNREPWRGLNSNQVWLLCYQGCSQGSSMYTKEQTSCSHWISWPKSGNRGYRKTQRGHLKSASASLIHTW